MMLSTIVCPIYPPEWPKQPPWPLVIFFAPMILKIGDEGGIDDMIFSHKWFMKGVYAFNGTLTNTHIARKFHMKSKDLILLMAARFSSSL